jgi:glutamine synthetase
LIKLRFPALSFFIMPIAHTPQELVGFIKDQSINFVDVKFADSFGQWHHITLPAHSFSEKSFVEGIPFDGSSIRGWQGIYESDMLLIPEVETAFVDPFFNEPTLSISCYVVDPITKEPYNKDPRSIAKKAIAYLSQTGIGDAAFFGPEAEFFIFDNVRFGSSNHYCFYEVDSVEGAWNSESEETPNQGHKVGYKKGYFPVPPIDQMNDIRLEMISTLEQVGLQVERGHHEVATGGQGEINYKFNNLVEAADELLRYKYVLKNVGYKWGKFVTFLPKPLSGDNGSGMHCHFSIWKGSQNLFAGKEIAGLSEIALFAIGGIIKHGRAIAAFSNPTVNSYHRLVPGFEAPIHLAYDYRNRSAAIRLPYTGDSEKAKRIECRFPDGSSNPYLTFTAILLAAIDGIQKQIHPGKPHNENIWEMNPKELKKLPKLPGSLEEALEALKADHQFLTDTGVVSKEFIDMWIAEKQTEIDAIRLTPHPKEFELYSNI